MPPPAQPQPLVTGVAPREGPPGTLVTIRGENLGTDSRDLLSVIICGVECVLTAEWVSKSKIIARSGLGTGTADVIVTTASGGAGSSTVTFKGYMVSTVIPTQEAAIFVDETHTFLTAWDKHRPVQEEILHSDNLLGLSDESNTSKYPAARLQELFPDSSGDVMAPSFSPKWYLLENHQSTSFEDLKSGLAFLNSRSSRHSGEPISFIKTNLNTFMECQDALITMHNKLVWDENQKALGLEKLTMLLQAADKDADSLFNDILRRKEKADAARNALGILGRFKFLFYLPPTIRANIDRGDYDLVINDYMRAKLFFKDTEVAVFKKVYSEVEREINMFRENLHSKLLQMPAPLDEKKKLIRHLVDLEYPGNPAWECIRQQHSWLIGVLNACQTSYQDRERDELNYGNNMYNKLSKDGPVAVPLILPLEYKAKAIGHVTQELPKVRTPLKVQFVEELSLAVTQHFSSLYRLGHAYFEGHLLRKDREETHKVKFEQQNNLQEFKHMIVQLITLYCNLVRRAFLPDSLENLVINKQRENGAWALSKIDLGSEWLPQCVRIVRTCAENLQNDLASDSESANLLQDLVFDLRTDTMKTILRQAIDDVMQLYTQESWTLDTNDASGSTTQLSTLFEHNVNEAINHLNEVVIRLKPGETDIFNDRTTQEDATALCVELVKAYITAIEKCAYDESPQMDVNSTTSDSQGAKLSDELPPLRRRLIISLSNCHHSLAKIMPRMVEMLDKHGYQETYKVMQYAETAFGQLSGHLFDSYVELKSDPIIGCLEQKMYEGQFDWATCREPLAVRSYIKDAITQIIEVHAEIYGILSTDFIPQVMTKIVSSVAEELYRLMVSISKLNKSGAVQARIDLLAFQLAMRSCLDPTASNHLQEAIETVTYSNQSKDEQKIERIIGTFKEQFKFHLLPFERLIGHSTA